jgi:hypothetical protein
MYNNEPLAQACGISGTTVPRACATRLARTRLQVSGTNTGRGPGTPNNSSCSLVPPPAVFGAWCRGAATTRNPQTSTRCAEDGGSGHQTHEYASIYDSTHFRTPNFLIDSSHVRAPSTSRTPSHRSNQKAAPRPDSGHPADPIPGRTRHYDTVNGLTVITENDIVITAFYRNAP